MTTAEMPTPRPPVSRFLLTACGIWLIGLGLYFMFQRPPLLPEDVRYMGTSLAEIHSAAPGFERWMHRVFTVMGGFMTGAGVLTVAMARTASAERATGNTMALALAGVLTVGTMSVTNFQLDSEFKWLLVFPALLWVIGLALPTVMKRWNRSP